MMALDKTFAVGEVLSAADVNAHLLGLWIPIDKRVVAAVTTVTFSGIDSSFRIFRLTLAADPNGDVMVLRLNNDSGTTYNREAVSFDGATVTAQRDTLTTELRLARTGTFEPQIGVYVISKLAANQRATIQGDCSQMGPIQLHGVAGEWTNTSALINRIDVLATNSASFSGVIALEGMRGV